MSDATFEIDSEVSDLLDWAWGTDCPDTTQCACGCRGLGPAWHTLGCPAIAEAWQAMAVRRHVECWELLEEVRAAVVEGKRLRSDLRYAQRAINDALGRAWQLEAQRDAARAERDQLAAVLRDLIKQIDYWGLRPVGVPQWRTAVDKARALLGGVDDKAGGEPDVA